MVFISTKDALSNILELLLERIVITRFYLQRHVTTRIKTLIKVEKENSFDNSSRCIIKIGSNFTQTATQSSITGCHTKNA